MNILVLIKQTFDTEEKILIEDKVISEDGVNFVINPYDEYAVEEAVKIKEKHGGEVTILTVGPERTESSIRTALAMGADKAIFVQSEENLGDEFTISKILASIAKKDQYDIIMAGYMAVDDGSAQVGPRLAEELNIPHVSPITRIELNGDTVNIDRDVEGDTEVIECKLPLLITAQQGLNEPRYPSLPGIMKAKKKPIERLSINDLEVNIEEIAAKTEVVDQFLPPEKTGGRVLEGELSDQVSELTQLLRNEAKVV